MVIANDTGTRCRLAWYLPTFQVVLALILGFWGSAQTRHYTGSALVLDYLAPAEFTLDVINMPAALLTNAVTRSAPFRIGPEYSTLAFILYLCFIGLLWFFVANRVVRPRKSFRSRNAKSQLLSVAGIIAGLLLVASGVALSRGPWALLLPLAAFLWGVALIGLSI